MEIDGKENLVKGAQVSKSPGKPTGQFIKSPGPKVAKLLDIFASGSPRPHDSDSEPESADKEELKYDFEKAQAKRVKKMRAAQAARLNESYMEASMVISNLLKSEEGEDDSSDVESANEIEATSSLTNQVETPKNRAQDVKKSLFSSSAEVEHPGFDVQKFLKNLNNKTTNEESAANSGSSRTDVIQREAASGQNEESPRPTAAVSFVFKGFRAKSVAFIFRSCVSINERCEDTCLGPECFFRKVFSILVLKFVLLYLFEFYSNSVA